jgi:hypothetical protein
MFDTKVLTLVAESCDATALFSRQSEDIGQMYRIVQYLETRAVKSCLFVHSLDVSLNHET